MLLKMGNVKGYRVMVAEWNVGTFYNLEQALESMHAALQDWLDLHGDLNNVSCWSMVYSKMKRYIYTFDSCTFSREGCPVMRLERIGISIYKFH